MCASATLFFISPPQQWDVFNSFLALSQLNSTCHRAQIECVSSRRPQVSFLWSWKWWETLSKVENAHLYYIISSSGHKEMRNSLAGRAWKEAHYYKYSLYIIAVQTRAAQRNLAVIQLKSAMWLISQPAQSRFYVCFRNAPLFQRNSCRRFCPPSRSHKNVVIHMWKMLAHERFMKYAK